MSAPEILRAVARAGGTALLVDGRLRLRAPRPLEAELVEAVRAEREAIIAELRSATVPRRPLGGLGAPAEDDPADWRDWYEERCAILEYDGRRPRALAERIMQGAAENAWHLRHGARPDPANCAGCGLGLAADAGDGKERPLGLPDGARVHFGGPHGVDCLIAYGVRWRGAAAAALAAMGIGGPQGHAATGSPPARSTGRETRRRHA